MAIQSITQAVQAIREALPPRFRCVECRRVMPRTIWDIREADGSTVCRACDIALAARFVDENPRPHWSLTDDRA